METNIVLEEYLEQYSSDELPILNKIYRETNIRLLNPRMVSGHITGLLLALISKMICPSKILEIGTYTGYSAICLAQGIKSHGKVITIEIDDEIAEIAQGYFNEGGYSEKIELLVGDALIIVPTLNYEFDLIYIDGEKAEYPDYLEVCLPKLKEGGILIADNVLWSEKVLGNEENMDTATKAIAHFNKKIKENNALEKVLLPLRDGLFICRKSKSS